MNSLVLNKCGFVAEGLATLAACVWSLSRMGALVLDKDVFVAEGCPTLTALIWPLSCVHPLVLNQSVFMAESLATVTALVVPLTAAKGLHTCAGLWWLAQGSRKGFPNLPACKGLL